MECNCINIEPEESLQNEKKIKLKTKIEKEKKMYILSLHPR